MDSVTAETVHRLVALRNKSGALMDCGRYQRSFEVSVEAAALAERALPADSLVLAYLLYTRFQDSAILAGATHGGEGALEALNLRDAAIADDVRAGKNATDLSWLPYGMGIIWRRFKDGTLFVVQPHEAAWDDALKQDGIVGLAAHGFCMSASELALRTRVPIAIRAAFVADAIRINVLACQQPGLAADTSSLTPLSMEARCLITLALGPVVVAQQCALQQKIIWDTLRHVRAALHISTHERAAALELAQPARFLQEWPADIAKVRATLEDARETAAADAARFGLRRCTLPSCAARELHAKAFKSCGRCRAAPYCCVDHQREDWRRHKREDGCKAPDDDAGGAGGAGGAAA